MNWKFVYQEQPSTVSPRQATVLCQPNRQKEAQRNSSMWSTVAGELTANTLANREHAN